MKTDYYELLGVSECATLAELKRGFRKQALKLHPDKNPSADAATLFNEVRTAYETLTDSQERSWYDSHKYQILAEDDDINSNNNEFDEKDDAEYYYNGTTVEDIKKYFSNNLYNRIDDSVQGFYQVVNVLTTKIASEEVTSGKKQMLPNFGKYKDDSVYSNACDPDLLLFPRFGNSKANYGTEVRLFYKVWSNFQSVKTFSWTDEYRYSTAPDRRTMRSMQRENKKVRQKSRKEYNETIRRWVAFIKRKDPRVNAKAQKEYEQLRIKKRQDALKQQAQNRKRQRNHETEEYEEYREQDWQQIDADELAQIEQELDKIYKEEERLKGEDSDSDQDKSNDIFECIVCNKTFKSEQKFAEHERSRKHKKKLKKLKWQMRKEGVELGIDKDNFVKEEEVVQEFQDAVEDPDDLPTDENNGNFQNSNKIKADHSNQLQNNHSAENNYSGQNESEIKNRTRNKTSKQDQEEVHGLFVNARNANKAPKVAEYQHHNNRHKDKQLQELTEILNEVSLEPKESSEDDWGTGKKKKRGRRKAKKGNKAESKNNNASVSVPKESSSVAKCAVCDLKFSSRNKLFEHINNTGHAVPLTKKCG